MLKPDTAGGPGRRRSSGRDSEARGYDASRHPVEELAGWLDAARTAAGAIDLMRLRSIAANERSANELALLEAIAGTP